MRNVERVIMLIATPVLDIKPQASDLVVLRFGDNVAWPMASRCRKYKMISNLLFIRQVYIDYDLHYDHNDMWVEASHSYGYIYVSIYCRNTRLHVRIKSAGREIEGQSGKKLYLLYIV